MVESLLNWQLWACFHITKTRRRTNQRSEIQPLCKHTCKHAQSSCDWGSHVSRQTPAYALAVGTIEWPQLDLRVTFLDDPWCWHTQWRSIRFPWSALSSVRQNGRLANVCPHFQSAAKAQFQWFTRISWRMIKNKKKQINTQWWLWWL